MLGVLNKVFQPYCITLAWHCLSPCTAELLLLLPVPSALAMPWLHPELFFSSQNHWKLLIVLLGCWLAGNVIGRGRGVTGIVDPAAWAVPRSIPHIARGSAGSTRIYQDLPGSARICQPLWLMHSRKWVMPHEQLPNAPIR
uniref:Uncharacterized protein n=1 Tax=Malurus cyaneus samueli TaxID=2593467 RepID=A0A8C5T7Y5_9PASS